MPHRSNEWRDRQRWRYEQESRRYGEGDPRYRGGSDRGTGEGYWRSPYSYDRQGRVPYSRQSGRRQGSRGADYGEQTPQERRYQRGMDYGRGDFGSREEARGGPEEWIYGEEDFVDEYYDEFGDMDLAGPDYWVYEEQWYVPGPYVGIGPRNYQRSDERLLEQVCDRLCMHGGLDARDISVEVQDGEVYLTGIIGDRYDKRLAEDIAESVVGVHDVHNRLRVQASDRHKGEAGSLGKFYSTEMGEDRGRIMMGMQVFGSDGEFTGEVKEVRGDDFLLDRPMARDVYVPFTAAQVRNGQVHLNVPSYQVEDQDWPQPALFGPGEERR